MCFHIKFEFLNLQGAEYRNQVLDRLLKTVTFGYSVWVFFQMFWNFLECPTFLNKLFFNWLSPIGESLRQFLRSSSITQMI